MNEWKDSLTWADFRRLLTGYYRDSDFDDAINRRVEITNQ